MSDTLYDRDLQLWIDQTIRQLKNREFESLVIRIPEDSEYPLLCPFSIEQILDEDFYGI
ncbi:DUF29 family protein [Gloeocapsa sp. PCC 73106]|uniref:DUF29 family protein n=1 Tax=Gloeocapsa sp. PCC 73106 TaxID=102232 RepID=UPI0002AD05E0|nr:DUF29 family protein [Gloeocapsa sp. PCC 73106]ELR97028.1 hypothetical protein GLO73106DRAFT_00008310 [Gloeocapsa sp. PCC 73106]